MKASSLSSTSTTVMTAARVVSSSSRSLLLPPPPPPPSRWKSKVASSSSIQRRLGLQVILVWSLAVLLIVNRRILVSYQSQSSSSVININNSDSINLLLATTTSASSNVTTNDNAATTTTAAAAAAFKFYILVVPNMTTALLELHGKDQAAVTYARFFNEDQAEMWLHRGLSHLSYEQGHTMDPNEADVFFIPGYLHYRRSLLLSSSDKNESQEMQQQQQQQTLAEQVMAVIVNKTKPHVLLIPTRDRTMNRHIGLQSMVQGLQNVGVNLYSVGFERNSWWQTVDTDHIMPIPYVVQPPQATTLPKKTVVVSSSSSALNNSNISNNSNNDRNSNSNINMIVPTPIMFQNNRTENFVFMSAHPRPRAISWSGCNRSMVSPLIGERDDMDIRLVIDDISQAATVAAVAATTTARRMTQKQYNQKMQTSDYCLILCGDTPTSRSLASAMMAGCIPLRVGSWWRGLCEPPCQLKYGWTIANKPHFPFLDEVNWDLFPELNETEFAKDPVTALRDFFNQTKTTLGLQNKQRARAEMHRVQKSWIYGWGNPVTSMQFGELYSYLWKSTLHEVGLLS